jgi:hypothetical protein
LYKIFIFALLILGSLGCNVPGSYVYAEEYILDMESSKLITIVRQFKNDHPEYVVPASLHIVDGKRDSADLWYHVYFFYPVENRIVKTWIRSTPDDKTTFAFVCLNEGLILGHWKYINKDFSFFENRRQKQLFEKRILRPINEEIRGEVHTSH